MAKREGVWSDFRKSPAALMKMVVEGKATVIGKDQYGRLIYRLEEECGE